MATKVIVRRKTKTVMDDKRYMTAARKKRREERRIRETQALELRAGGATYDQIATALGLTDKSHAKKIIDAAIDRFEIEAAKSVVRMDLMRLDEYIMRCTHDLRSNGNLSQIDRLLRIMEFRYRLLGITDETVRTLQGENGITNINIKGGVQVVQARQETEEEFLKKMMSAVGVDPESPGAKKYLKDRDTGVRALPMLAGSANSGKDVSYGKTLPDDEAEIVDAVIVEDD